MHDLEAIHKTKGKICSYVLKCEGDGVHEYYVYCGFASDLEKRMLQHTGVCTGGAVFTKAHPPTAILSVCVHKTVEDAMVAECANWNLWAGLLGDFNRVRGARFNGLEKLNFHPEGGIILRKRNV